MKAIVLAAALTGLMTSVAAAQGMGPPPPGHPVCLRPFDVSGPGGIIQTHVVDPQTILFYTPDRKIWKNTLKGPCPGLMFHGFEYVTHQDEICSNAQAIRVIESGEVCELGEFTPYLPAQHAAR